MRLARSNEETLLDAPGSVAVTNANETGCEVLICNNDGHTVTRHLLEGGAPHALRSSEVLLHKHLNVPDGVSVTRDGRWIALSNHATHNVLLYQNSPALNAETEPVGILRRVHFPHGLRFSGDGRHLFVADAGAPYLHIYAQDADGWRGVRNPVATVTIMDDALFQKGRHNPEEGGAKGLDLDRNSNVLVVTSECQPLAFFAVSDLMQQMAAVPSVQEESRRGLDHELTLMQEIRRLRAEKSVEADDLRKTVSWRITAPLRRVKSIFRR